jgi:hypothetical protein
VTVSFRSTSLDKQCTSYNAPPTSRKRPAAVDHFNFSCLAALFSWLEKPRNRMRRDLDCMADVLMGFHRSTFSKPNTEFNAISGLLQPRKGSCEARKIEVINGLQNVFEKWVERCKKYIACQGSTSKKRPAPHLHKVPTRSNKVSPRTLQTAFVQRLKLRVTQKGRNFFKR